MGKSTTGQVCSNADKEPECFKVVVAFADWTARTERLAEVAWTARTSGAYWRLKMGVDTD